MSVVIVARVGQGRRYREDIAGGHVAPGAGGEGEGDGGAVGGGVAGGGAKGALDGWVQMRKLMAVRGCIFVGHI